MGGAGKPLVRIVEMSPDAPDTSVDTSVRATRSGGGGVAVVAVSAAAGLKAGEDGSNDGGAVFQ